MKDGFTKKLNRPRDAAGSFERFVRRFDVRLVAVSGPCAGLHYPLERARVTIGRGPGVDLAFNDETMSRQHAAFEFAGEAFGVRDLGSTNGVVVNGEPVRSAPLEHGDRLQIGAQTFQVLIETRSSAPDVYELNVEV